MNVIISIKEVKLGQNLVSPRLKRIVMPKIIDGGVNPWAYLDIPQLRHISGDSLTIPEQNSGCSNSSDSEILHD